MNVEGCLACDVLAGRLDVPGGTIDETAYWHADHCIGPFGVGAIVDGLGAERAYLTMWVDKPPLHVHMVVYPRWPSDEKRGWDLDRERWAAGPPPFDDAARAAARLRAFLSQP